MKNLELTEAEAEALERLLRAAINDDRYFLSLRVETWRRVLEKLRAEPPRPAASPAPRVYEPPSKGRYRRRS